MSHTHCPEKLFDDLTFDLSFPVCRQRRLRDERRERVHRDVVVIHGSVVRRGGPSLWNPDGKGDDDGQNLFCRRCYKTLFWRKSGNSRFPIKQIQQEYGFL